MKSLPGRISGNGTESFGGASDAELVVRHLCSKVKTQPSQPSWQRDGMIEGGGDSEVHLTAQIEFDVGPATPTSFYLGQSVELIKHWMRDDTRHMPLLSLR